MRHVAALAELGDPMEDLLNKVTSLDPGTGYTVRAAWFPT